MTSPDELEQAAMQAARTNCPDPPSDLLDCFLYLALYSLYAVFYAGQMSRTSAKETKERLITQYAQQKKAYALRLRQTEETLHYRKRLEQASGEYAANPGADNANRLWAAVNDLKEGSKPK